MRVFKNDRFQCKTLLLLNTFCLTVFNAFPQCFTLFYTFCQRFAVMCVKKEATGN